MTWAGLALRILFTAGWLALTVGLLRRGVTAGRYSAALGGLLVVVLLWLTRPETAARLQMLGVQIDRQIEAAEDVKDWLERTEAAAKAAARELAEMVEREALRPFATTEFSGRREI